MTDSKPSLMTALRQQRKSTDSVSRKLWLAIVSDMKGFIVSTFVSSFSCTNSFETKLLKDDKFSTIVRLKSFSQFVGESSKKERYSEQLLKQLRKHV